MSSRAKRTVRLPPEQANYVDELVSSGAYGSTSEVVCAGLQALRERDGTVERWLREDVIPVYQAMAKAPRRALPAKTVFADVRSHHAKRMKKAARGA